MNRVYGRAGVPALGFRPLDAREGRLEREHRPRVVLGRRATGQLEDARQVLLILDADARERLFVLQVVVAIGQEGAPLRDAHDGRARIERVDADRPAEGAAGRDRRQVTRFGRQIAGRSDGVDPPELGLDRRRAELLDARLVDDARVEVRDLLRRGSPRPVRARGDLFDDGAKIELGPVRDLRERAVAHAVAGHRDACQPAAVHVAIQIVLGEDRPVEPGDVEAGPRGLRVRHDPGQQASAASAALKRMQRADSTL